MIITSISINLRKWEFLWPGFALLPLLLIAFLLPVSMQDYWWYLRLGKDILAGGAIPNFDAYSFTHAGEPIVNLTWLSAVLLWLAYSAGSLTGTFLLRGLIIGITYGFLWILVRRCGANWFTAGLLVFIAGLAGSNNWSFRPQLFIYPLFMLTLLILWDWHNRQHGKLWVLPFIALLWTNLHGSFLLIFILIAPMILFVKKGRLILILWTLAAFVATLFNPYGLSLWTTILNSLISPLSFNLSSEWFPPTNQGWQMNIYFGWLLALIPLASISSKKLTVVEWLWLLGLGWLSLSSIRFVIWELFIFALCTARLLTGLGIFRQDENETSTKPIGNLITWILIPAFSLIALPGLRDQFGLHEPAVIASDTPIAAVAWLADHEELPGPMLNDISYGSYIIFALPSRLVWIDTRFEMIYPASQYIQFQELGRAGPSWEETLQDGGINLLFLSQNNQPNLIRAVEKSDQWCEEYRDDDAVIFSRCEPIQ